MPTCEALLTTHETIIKEEQKLARITSLYCPTRGLISVQGPGIERGTACQCSPAGLTYEYQFDYSMDMQRDMPRADIFNWHCKVRKQNTDVNKLHYTCIRKRILKNILKGGLWANTPVQAQDGAWQNSSRCITVRKTVLLTRTHSGRYTVKK